MLGRRVDVNNLDAIEREIDALKDARDRICLSGCRPLTLFGHMESYCGYSDSLIRAQINGRFEVITEELCNVWLPYRSAAVYLEYWKQALRELIRQYEIGLNGSLSDFLSRMEGEEELQRNPDNCEEFKYLRDNTGNWILRALNMMLHPFSSLVGAMVLAPGKVVVRSFLDGKDQEKHEDNLRKVGRFVGRGTLIERQMVYRAALRPMLIQYFEIKRLVDQRHGIKFRYCPQNAMSPGIEGIEAWRPTDSLNVTATDAEQDGPGVVGPVNE